MYKQYLSTLLLLYSHCLFAEEDKDVCISSDNINIRPIDKTYNYLNSQFCQPAVWFDSFFVDDRVTEDARAGTMIRWYNDLTLIKSQGPEFETRLSARVNLPKVSKKVKLVIESDFEDDGIDTPQDNTQESENNSLGLRYDAYAKGRSSFNIKATFRPSIELRYRYSYPFTEATLARFTQKIYQKEKVTGESTHLDIDHAINPIFLLRWANFAKYENDIDAFELGTGLTLYQYISKRRALSYKASISGYHKPYLHVHNSHLSITYRQNILRKWLFYELIPEVNWEREIDTNQTEELSFTLRLEVLFINI